MPRTSALSSLPAASIPQWLSGLAALTVLLGLGWTFAAWSVQANAATQKVPALERRLDQHISQEEKERSDLLRSIENSLSTMKQDLAAVKTDLSWLKRNR